MITFFKEDSLTVAASIAYFALLSIFPMLLLLVSLGGIYIRRFELSGELNMVLEGVLPGSPLEFLRNVPSIGKSAEPRLGS